MAYTQRSNLWTWVIYPDSRPENYIYIIKNWHIPVLLSPEHNKDINGDETEKKDHIHCMIYFGRGQNKSFDQVREYTDQLNGTIPKIVHNKNSLVRYFIHLDNPEKTQYNRDDIISLSGFEYEDAFTSWSTDQQLYEELEKLIIDYKIYNMYDLLILVKDKNDKYLIDFLRHHTMYFNAVLTGLWQKCKAEQEKALRIEAQRKEKEFINNIKQGK